MTNATDRGRWRATVGLLVRVGAVVAVASLLAGAPTTAIAGAPGSTFDTAAYTYDAPAQSSLPGTVASCERASPPGQGAVSWGNSLAVGGCGVAANGGVASVPLGQAGENAVRGAFDIGPKATAQIGGRTRIFDGLNDVAVSEVKNVKYQAYTQQLKDSLAYAQQNGLRFDLYVRGGANPTTLSGPLEAAIRNGDIGLRYIP